MKTTSKPNQESWEYNWYRFFFLHRLWALVYMVSHKSKIFEFKVADPVRRMRNILEAMPAMPTCALILTLLKSEYNIKSIHPFIIHSADCFIMLCLVLSSLTGLNNNYYTCGHYCWVYFDHLFAFTSISSQVWHLIVTHHVWSLKQLTFQEYIGVFDILKFWTRSGVPSFWHSKEIHWDIAGYLGCYPVLSGYSSAYSLILKQVWNTK